MWTVDKRCLPINFQMLSQNKLLFFPSYLIFINLSEWLCQGKTTTYTTPSRVLTPTTAGNSNFYNEFIPNGVFLQPKQDRQEDYCSGHGLCQTSNVAGTTFLPGLRAFLTLWDCTRQDCERHQSVILTWQSCNNAASATSAASAKAFESSETWQGSSR